MAKKKQLGDNAHRLLSEYPLGSDITVINVDYHKLQKDIHTGKTIPNSDFLNIVFKDNVTGEKHNKFISAPGYSYYLLPTDPGYNMFYARMEDCKRVDCKYTDILRSIAENTGSLDFYRNADYRERELLHTAPTVLGSDIHVEDFYRAEFDRQYENQPCAVTKGFLDIEVDGINLPPDKFPEKGECPINAVSFIDEKSSMVHCFLLETVGNPQIQEFKEGLKDGSIMKELKEFVIEATTNKKEPEKSKKFKIEDLDFKFHFYDEEDEILLIRDLFLLINALKPDFLMAWNMAFDIPYIIERCKVLGYDPAEILSDPMYEHKYANYFIDERHKMDYEARGDKYSIASDVTFLDQLIQFASRRKGQAVIQDFKLDTVGNAFAGVRKLNYSHITTRISELPYKSYKTFVFYNIFDTIVQKCIEASVGDIDYIFNKCLANNTRYDKGHRQTYYLTNRMIKEFRAKGLIFGNNINKYNAEAVDFEGAMVNDPLHNSDYAKVREGHIVYNLIKNMMDYDYTSLYPSITIEHNMAPNTIIFKVFIPEPVHAKENASHNPRYDRGGAFMDDMMTRDYVDVCERWFGLPSAKEVIGMMAKELISTGIPDISPESAFKAVTHEMPFEIPGYTSTKQVPFELPEFTDMYHDITVDNKKTTNIDYTPYLDVVKV